MGEIEHRSKKRARRKNLKKIILNTLYLSGAVSVALLAPNVLGALHRLGLDPTKRREESVRAARKRLIEEGLITEKSGMLSITKTGERELRMLDPRAYQLKKPKKWDGRWRVLIFDIPEKRKNIRLKLRLTLRTIGFVRLQDSVWIYPYECDDFVALLKTDFRIGKDLLYMIVDSLEGDQRFRTHFKLPH